MSQASFLLTVLAILHLSIFTGASPTSEDIATITRLYHEAIRAHTGLTSLSNSDIETALRTILTVDQQTPAPRATANRGMECQPSLHLINPADIKSQLVTRIERARAVRGFFTYYIDDSDSSAAQFSNTCLMTYRCKEHTSCCGAEGEVCSVKTSSDITVDVTVSTRRGTFIEQLTFPNHTECACQRPVTTRCVCPHPYKYTPLDSSDRPCACECRQGLEQQCLRVQSGRESIGNIWSQQVHLINRRDQYEACYISSRREVWSRHSVSANSTYCPTIPCTGNLTFDPRRMLCIAAQSEEIISSTPSMSPTEHRTIRDVEQFQNHLESPALIENTTTTLAYNSTTNEPTITTARPQDRSKLIRRLERKLKYIQENNLVRPQSDNRIGRKIYNKYLAYAGRNSTQVEDEIVIKTKMRAPQVTCKLMAKREYTIFAMHSHYMFCSVGVS